MSVLFRIEHGSEAYKAIRSAITWERDVSIQSDGLFHVKIKVGEGMWTPRLSTEGP